VVDPTWCTQDRSLPMTNPFPFWLYGDRIDYLRNLMSERAMRFAFRRIGIALGLRRPTDALGYSDYERGKVWNFHPDMSAVPARASVQEPIVNLPFPALERLAAYLDGLRSSAPFVVVMPPMFITALPRPGTAEAAQVAACKVALGRLVARRPGARLLDFHLDDDVARDPRNFMDVEHYRGDVARRVEASIAAAVNSGAGPRAQSEPFDAPLNRQE
jgi:hypothetical protein